MDFHATPAQKIPSPHWTDKYFAQGDLHVGCDLELIWILQHPIPMKLLNLLRFSCCVHRYPSTMTGVVFFSHHATRQISAACISSLPNGDGHFVVIAYQRGGLEGNLRGLLDNPRQSQLNVEGLRHKSTAKWNEQMDVSENSGTPKLSILIGFSIINHPFWGTPIFGNTQMFIYIYRSLSIYRRTWWKLWNLEP